LVVLCAGSMLPLAKQSLDEAPYKLSKAVTKLVGITFSRLSLSYWIDYLGFITKGKLASIFIKTFSWGFPTGRLFILHQLGPITRPGRAVAWCGPPGPPLTSPPATSLSLPKFLHSIAQTQVLAVLACNFLSPCSAHLRC
jgi:hypothetical protein